jgi:hypothetical protein
VRVLPAKAPWPALVEVAVGKTKVGPIPIRSPVFFLSGRQHRDVKNREVAELCSGSPSGALNRHQLKGWPDQLHKRQESVWWYAWDQWPNEELIGLKISEAQHLRRAGSIVGRRVAIPDDYLGKG